MTRSKEFFVSLDEGYTSKVKLGDGKFHDIKGKGVVAVESKRGNSKLIYDVHFVPGLAANLLSLGQLLRKGYKINFDDDEGTIIDKKNNSVVAKVKMNLMQHGRVEAEFVTHNYYNSSTKSKFYKNTRLAGKIIEKTSLTNFY